MSRSVPPLNDLVGVPFLDLGRDPRKGLGCWGLVMEVERRMGVSVPDYNALVSAGFDVLAVSALVSEETSTPLWDRVRSPEVGDVVAMATHPEFPGLASHFGVYIGDGKIIHSIQKHKVSIVRTRHLGLFGTVLGYYRWSGR